MAGAGEVFPEKSSTGGGRLRVLFLGLGSRLEVEFREVGSFFGSIGGNVIEEGGRKALVSRGELLGRLELLEVGDTEALLDSSELLDSLSEELELELEDIDELGEFEDSEANSYDFERPVRDFTFFRAGFVFLRAGFNFFFCAQNVGHAKKRKKG